MLDLVRAEQPHRERLATEVSTRAKHQSEQEHSVADQDEGGERLHRDEVMGRAARRTNPRVPVPQEDLVEHRKPAAFARRELWVAIEEGADAARHEVQVDDGAKRAADVEQRTSHRIVQSTHSSRHVHTIRAVDVARVQAAGGEETLHLDQMHAEDGPWAKHQEPRHRQDEQRRILCRVGDVRHLHRRAGCPELVEASERCDLCKRVAKRRPRLALIGVLVGQCALQHLALIDRRAVRPVGDQIPKACRAQLRADDLCHGRGFGD
eukprot:3178914-Prymnesium_polylepis.2